MSQGENFRSLYSPVIETSNTAKLAAALALVLQGAVISGVRAQEATAFATPAYSNVGLLPGDVLSVRELLMATMVSSGDDAAYALAESLGHGSIDDFVERMNGEAEALGLEDTTSRTRSASTPATSIRAPGTWRR